MAFAAIRPEAGRIDATLPDLGRGLTWDQVHKTRPRVALRCPECGHGVHANRNGSARSGRQSSAGSVRSKPSRLGSGVRPRNGSARSRPAPPRNNGCGRNWRKIWP
ncbi:hypothetical protein GA0074694_5342 [Micromonospora inyonensis]|uniref:Uncharacterized protein n=1 Tax=Micromonospora inyonensis TaxID=47866 RepID=A0A1C6SIQ0_9ACTN|nr:hypothetical protein GA0074694_5342 [Micromonospora inyonensis]